MGVIIKFPDGRTEEKNCISMYRDVNGTDYIVLETDKMENENRIVGVSHKPQNETLFSCPVNSSTDKAWDATKKVLVDDIHDKKDDFVYIKPTEEIMVTENFVHELALRDANYQKLAGNYQAFLKAEEEKQAQTAINPFEQQPLPDVQQPETPVLEQPQPLEGATPVVEQAPVSEIPSPIQPETPNMENIPGPEVVAPIENAPVEMTPVGTPEINNSVVEQQPIVEEATIPTAPVIENTPVAQSAPVVEETPIVNEAVNPVEEPKKEKESIVSKSYMENASELISKVREMTDKYIENMEEMKNEIGRQLEEAKKINELAKQTYDNAQQIVSSQMTQNDLTRDLTKVA